MKKRVFKFYSNYEKEEIWLNKMAADGWHCIDYVFGRYTFERGEPCQYTYRLQLLDYPPRHVESAAYLEFLEEVGIEMVASHLRWVYLRKKTADGPFELFSDRESRIAHYKRIIIMLLPLAIVNLVFGLGFHGAWQPLNVFNLGAAILLGNSMISYYRRILSFEKEGQVWE